MALATSSTSSTVPIEPRRLRHTVNELPELERRVLTWRFGLDGLTLTRREIADRLKLKTTAVATLERAALARLRAQLEAAA
jgi:DNA-directed RNA polymerase specialized sigma subunit